MTRSGLRDAQDAVLDGEIGSGRDDIEVVWLYHHSICSLPYGHRRVAGKQLDHHAFVGRIEMLDKDEGHAGAGRKRLQEFSAGIEATSRGAYSDDCEISRSARRAECQGHATASGPIGPIRIAF